MNGSFYILACYPGSEANEKQKKTLTAQHPTPTMQKRVFVQPGLPQLW
jgi:hypothetical protein